MKRVLFVVPGFRHGGTNRCLLNVLSCLDKNEYSIDIFALSHAGPYRQIFDPAHILPGDLWLASIFESYEYIRHQTKGEKIKKLAAKSAFRIGRYLFGTAAQRWVFARSAQKITDMNYDTVVAMQEGVTTSLVSQVKAHKVAWIHCDYSQYFAQTKTDEEAVYSQYDHIICVSGYTQRIFADQYPSLAPKCHGIHNMMDYEAIIAMSGDVTGIDTRFDPGSFGIISVGRLSPVKQFDIIPELANHLRAEGCQFRWHIIGDGEEKTHIQEMIAKYRVSDCVVLLGEKDNPYPYIKQSKLLVCTSVSEACPLVINEARILHVPVVTTDFGSAPEFINSGFDGMIASLDNLKNAIEEMIKNRAFYQQIQSNISSFRYSNERIIDEISAVL